MVLKLYCGGNWSIDEVSWEVKLAAHLAAGGVPVQRVQPLADGKFVGRLDSAEGVRPFALAEFIEGDKPRPPFNDDLYAEFGRLVAAVLVTGDGLSIHDFDLAAAGWRAADLTGVASTSFRGAESVGEGWADRELAGLRRAAGELL